MKKMLLLGAALMALSFVPASATPGNGCAASGGEQNAATSCSYVAGSTTARFVAATPNSWTITAVRGSETVTLASSPTAPPSSGVIDTIPGETITITMGPDCVPGDFVCGSIGTVSAHETN